MCGFFKRTCLGLQKFLPPTQSLLGFAARVVGTHLPGTRTLGWGPGMRLEVLAPKLSLPNFYLPHVGERTTHSVWAPPTSLHVCGFFYSIVVRLPFNSISEHSE